MRRNEIKILKIYFVCLNNKKYKNKIFFPTRMCMYFQKKILPLIFTFFIQFQDKSTNITK